MFVCSRLVVSMTSRKMPLNSKALQICLVGQTLSCVSTCSLYRREPAGAHQRDNQRRRQSESQTDRQSSKNLPVRYNDKSLLAQSVTKTSTYI